VSCFAWDSTSRFLLNEVVVSASWVFHSKIVQRNVSECFKGMKGMFPFNSAGGRPRSRALFCGKKEETIL
jgi:hypothetical protein